MVPAPDDPSAKFCAELAEIREEMTQREEDAVRRVKEAAEDEKGVAECEAVLETWQKGLAGYRFATEYQKAQLKAHEVARDMHKLGKTHRAIRDLDRECKRLRRKVLGKAIGTFVMSTTFWIAVGVMVAAAVAIFVLVRYWPGVAR